MIWGNQLKNALCLRRKNDLNLLNTKPASQCNEHAPVDPASLITLGQMVSQPTLPKSLLKTFKLFVLHLPAMAFSLSSPHFREKMYYCHSFAMVK